jgi:hypothetical protein
MKDSYRKQYDVYHDRRVLPLIEITEILYNSLEGISFENIEATREFQRIDKILKEIMK